MEDDDEEEEELKDPKHIVDEIISTDRVDDYIGDNYGQEYVDRDLIELDFDIGRSRSKKVSKLLQREGVLS